MYRCRLLNAFPQSFIVHVDNNANNTWVESQSEVTFAAFFSEWRMRDKGTFSPPVHFSCTLQLST